MRRFKSILRLMIRSSLAVFVAVNSSWSQPPDKPAYLQGMKTIISGGVTPEGMTPAQLAGLQEIGTRRLRLISVDVNVLQSVAADGTLAVKWPVRLTYHLHLCQRNHWIPHIIIGQTVPPPLALTDASGRKYGPSSWDVYDRYINTFLKYVVLDQGFTETEWEVGNEMNATSQNWAAAERPAASTDEPGFQAYMTLYAHIANDIDAFRRQHPGVTLRVGGPAEAEDGHVHPPADWTTRFVQYTAAHGIPADFVSFHVYGNSTTGAVVENVITAIRQELAAAHSHATLAVTEWGPNYNPGPGLNYDPMAGAFALDFTAKMAFFGIHDTMFLSLSQFPKSGPWGWPALYSLEGSPTHDMLAFQAIAHLKGKPTPCLGTSGVSCVATLDANGEVHVVFWNYDWMKDRFPSVMPSRGSAASTFTISPIENSTPTTYDLDTAKMNSGPWPGDTPSAGFAQMSSSGLRFSLNVPYGSYGELIIKPHAGASIP